MPCAHTFVGAWRSMCTDITVQAPVHLCVHPHTHVPSWSPRGHEHSQPCPGRWKYLHPCPHMPSLGSQEVCVLLPRISPMRAGQSHGKYQAPGGADTDTRHTSLGQWAPCTCILTHSHVCTLEYTHTHRQRNTQACTCGSRGLNSDSQA